MAAGAVGFSDDGIPLTNAGIVRQALVEARKNDTLSACTRKIPPTAYLVFNEHIAQRAFSYLWATGVAEYSMIARDVMDCL